MLNPSELLYSLSDRQCVLFLCVSHGAHSEVFKMGNETRKFRWNSWVEATGMLEAFKLIFRKRRHCEVMPKMPLATDLGTRSPRILRGDFQLKIQKMRSRNKLKCSWFLKGPRTAPVTVWLWQCSGVKAQTLQGTSSVLGPILPFFLAGLPHQARTVWAARCVRWGWEFPRPVLLSSSLWTSEDRACSADTRHYEWWS